MDTLCGENLPRNPVAVCRTWGTDCEAKAWDIDEQEALSSVKKGAVREDPAIASSALQYMRRNNYGVTNRVGVTAPSTTTPRRSQIRNMKLVRE